MSDSPPGTDISEIDDLDREVWQAQPGTTLNSWPEVLWPKWRSMGVVSIGYGTEDASESDPDDLHDQVRRLAFDTSPGDIVVAKAGTTDLLGLGVVTSEGYEFAGEEPVQFSTDDGSDEHHHLCHVEWVLVRGADNPVSIEDYELSTQFHQSTFCRYHEFDELQQALLDDGSEEFRDGLGRLDERSFVHATGRDASSQPRIWIEKTKVEGRPYKQSGELALGNAIMSPSRDRGGRKQYEELREASVGDIVLHFLQGDHEIVGASVISSGLREDFEGPPTGRWSDEQSEQGGYLRWLSNYEELETPLQVYEDVLENQAYTDELRQIREDHTKIFYNSRLSLNQGHYFTQCPPPLTEIFVGECPQLADLLGDRGYSVETSDGGDQSGSKLKTRSEPPERGETIERQLTGAKQLVFHGPPGTGKTYTAQEFARWWLGERCDEPLESQLEVVTFHPSFTYEDFIEGLTAEEADGSVEYKVKSGVFKSVCEGAREAYHNHRAGQQEREAPPYVLIIDEVNRGNLAQIFGEIITLLEPDKREGARSETAVTLPHSKERFTVPPNLYIIGTMNTADRSIALVDAALRRRFRFLHFPPNMDVLSEAYGFGTNIQLKQAATDLTDPAGALLARSILAWEQLNARIRESPQLGRGKQLGHSYLLGVDRTAAQEEQILQITDAWQFEILPLLEEYYFGQFDEIASLFGSASELLLDSDHQEIQNINPEELAKALETVANLDEDAWNRSGTTVEETDASDQSMLGLLYTNGLIEIGTRLKLQQDSLPGDPKFPDGVGDDFLHCTVSGKPNTAESVRWEYDNRLYSLSRLTLNIDHELRETDRSSYPGAKFWSREGDDQTLYELGQSLLAEETNPTPEEQVTD